MDFATLAYTLQTIGHVLIAYTAIRVHFRFRQEHKVDEDVFNVMKKEQIIGIAGIIFVVVGYIFHII
ncbi:MAG: hypothetical protein WD471_02090 [Candidatus Paceibacterota bacterium]